MNENQHTLIVYNAIKSLKDVGIEITPYSIDEECVTQSASASIRKQPQYSSQQIEFCCKEMSKNLLVEIKKRFKGPRFSGYASVYTTEHQGKLIFVVHFTHASELKKPILLPRVTIKDRKRWWEFWK